MTNYSAGHLAETEAANYIKAQGFKIVATNWKNRICEIDVIAEKNKTIHFIEVKYRQNDLQGNGFDYITSRKLKQMAFAAQMWVQENNWNDNYCLGAIELTGADFKVTDFLETI